MNWICPVCGGELKILGVLGGYLILRCQDCHLETQVKMPTDEEMESEAEDE